VHEIRASLLLWFNDYLTDRFQRVVLENVASDWASVTSRVPYWSILWPLLFSIFIDTLPNSLSSGSKSALFVLYADDSKEYRLVLSSLDSTGLEQDLNNLEVWNNTNSLPFNSLNEKLTLLLERKIPNIYPYRLPGNDLIRCTEEVDQGITITYNLLVGLSYYANPVYSK
jgi:hypothetical protein